jgi:hypothetical protein
VADRRHELAAKLLRLGGLFLALSAISSPPAGDVRECETLALYFRICGVTILHLKFLLVGKCE